MTLIASNTSTKNTIDGEIAAVVVAVVIVASVVIVDMALAADEASAEADMLEFGDETTENRPCVSNLAGLNWTRHYLVLEVS